MSAFIPAVFSAVEEEDDEDEDGREVKPEFKDEVVVVEEEIMRPEAMVVVLVGVVLEVGIVGVLVKYAALNFGSTACASMSL
jgi:ribosomal protein L18E